MAVCSSLRLMTRHCPTRLIYPCHVRFLAIKTGTPCRGAIVGSGPAAFYCAESLYRNFSDALMLDMYERLPVPYGLVRFGVAPDHPDLKKCIGGFERMIDRVGAGQRFQFYGNVRVGVDVKVDELLRAYHFVVLAYGAESERKLGIAGEDAVNCFSARTVVNWYNGLPEASGIPINLRGHDTAVVFGHGNVALDVARTLLTPTDVLASTDITQHALEALKRSTIRRCILIGRRGPLQVAFTTAELRQMIQTARVAAIFDPNDFDTIQPILPNLERARKRLTTLMYDTAKNAAWKNTTDIYSKWELRFLRSPTRILTDNNGTVRGVELAVNRLQSMDGGFADDKAVDTGERETVECGLVVYSIGYKTLNLDEQVPFDRKRHVIQTDQGGRVSNLPNLYACGWCSRGPVGVLAATQIHAKAVAENIWKDAGDGRFSEQKTGSALIGRILNERGVRPVLWRDWVKIDGVEKDRGAKVGKPREKLVDYGEMLDIARTGA